ncbi:MAG: hypothetical protein WC641_07865 [Patescibacteria group bacterium]
MANRIIEGTAFPILPSMISVERHFHGALGNSATEASARWIVRLCQELASWGPFTLEQIEGFYHRNGRPEEESFRFNRLTDSWVIFAADGKYRVTDDFILCCYRVSPAD